MLDDVVNASDGCDQHTDSKEEPKDDEVVLITDVLADLAYHFVPTNIEKYYKVIEYKESLLGSCIYTILGKSPKVSPINLRLHLQNKYKKEFVIWLY